MKKDILLADLSEEPESEAEDQLRSLEAEKSSFEGEDGEEEETTRDEKGLAAINKKIREQKKKVQVLEAEQISLLNQMQDKVTVEQAKALIL